MSSRLHIPFIAFLHVNIGPSEQLCQQLVRPVARTCFRFFVSKNRNARAAMPATGQAGRTYVFLLFHW